MEDIDEEVTNIGAKFDLWRLDHQDDISKLRSSINSLKDSYIEHFGGEESFWDFLQDEI